MSVKKHGLVAALALVAGTTLAAGIAGYDKNASSLTTALYPSYVYSLLTGSATCLTLLVLLVIADRREIGKIKKMTLSEQRPSPKV